MEVKIIFGSENSEAEDLAIIAKKNLGKLGFDTEIMNMREVYLSDLKRFKNILLIIGTSLDGEPPESAEDFYDELSLCDMPEVLEKNNLSNLNYAVFTVGQSYDENFGKAGIDFDKFLKNFGAKRLLKVEKADKNFEADFPIWLDKVEDKLKKTEE